MPRALIPCAVALTATLLSAQDIPDDLLLPPTGSGAILTDTDFSRDVLLGDLDGDGDLDALVTNRGSANAVYLNDGNFAFTRDAGNAISVDGGQTMSGVLGDVDGDGDLDVFVVNRSSEPNWLYINQGGDQAGTEGQFARATTGVVTSDVGKSRAATFADVDADGDLDLYVANLGNESNFLYINQGGDQAGTEGTFARNGGDESETAGGVSHAGVFGDIDGDGDLDLIVPNGGGLFTPAGAVNFLFTNDGDGNFTRVLTGDAVTSIANTKCALLADFDSDGDLDLFLGNDTAQENQILINDGAGNFTNTSDRLTAPLSDTNSGVLADLEGDGDLDIVLVNLSGDDNEVYLNNGIGRFVVQVLGPVVHSGGSTAGVAVGHLNGDSNPDIVMVNEDGGAFVYRNDGRQWTNLENALAGTGAKQPVLRAEGTLEPVKVVKVMVDKAFPNTSAALVLGLSTIFAPLKGGVLVPAPDVIFFGLPIDAMGRGSIMGHMPLGAPPMFQMNFQWWVSDPGAPNGFSASNAVRGLAP